MYRAGKRIFDVVVSLLVCVVLIPTTLILGIVIKLDSRGPVFFCQQRVGLGGKVFTMYKYRSMYVGAECDLKDLLRFNERNGPSFKMKDDPRVTKVGKWLRKFSIDELPQFFNVLKGDMSIVGPRPATVYEVIEYSEEAWFRLSVQQGITGEWQVFAHNDPDFGTQLEHDLHYVENRYWLNDLRIVLLTIPSIVKEVKM